MPAPPAGFGITRLLEIVAILRGDEGCPWDREQTLDTLKPFLIEEAYELLEAIDRRDADLHREELGDVLLQVALQSQLRSEEAAFDFNDVADTLSEKLIRRHPHVFGNVDADTSDAVVRNWEAIKRDERADDEVSLLDGIPKALPALQQAQSLQARAARVGFDWDCDADVLDKIGEEIAELREALQGGRPQDIQGEIGDLLFSVVNLSRRLSQNAEEALREANAKFTRRFQWIERTLSREGRSPREADLAELDRLWDSAKAAEQNPTP